MADAEPVGNFRVITVDDSLQIESFNEDDTISVGDNFKALGARHVESVFDPDLEVLRPPQKRGLGENGFMTAVRTSYSSHVPLTLSPDHIWTLIAQGISTHIEKNAEKFRDMFVEFDGRQVIRIIRNQFTKGSQNNDWAGCFGEFSEKIEGFIGKEMKGKLCPHFSTTTLDVKACHELGLMDCMKSYFDYRVQTRCGISKVKIQGSTEDWQKLEDSLNILKELELDSWANVLQPILNNFTRAAAGEDTDQYFWDTIYKAHRGGGSGSHPTVDGWATNFFLYINDEIRASDFRSLDVLQKEVTAKEGGHRWHSPGIPQTAIQAGLSKTPFIWEYHGAEIPMFFYGGFAGAKFEDGYVSPVLGWAVGEQPKA